MIHKEPSAAQHCRNPLVAVSALVFVENCCDFFLNRRVFVCFLHLFQVIIECCTGQLND